MRQVVVVARLAVRELWISFRLFAVIAAFVAAGALVALAPAPLPATAGRLAAGLAAATVVVAAVAAWSMAAERRAGYAGWLVSRSVPRATLLVGWLVALWGAALVGLVGAAVLGWLTVASVTLRLEPAGYVTLVTGVAAAALLAVALGLVLGALLPPALAASVAVVASAAVGLVAWALPVDPSLVPGGAYVALAALSEPGAAPGPGLRATGAGLAAAAIVIVSARAVIERAEL